jgi:hypothetical protein
LLQSCLELWHLGLLWSCLELWDWDWSSMSAWEIALNKLVWSFDNQDCFNLVWSFENWDFFQSCSEKWDASSVSAWEIAAIFL